MRTFTIIKIEDNNTESVDRKEPVEELVRACRVCLATDIKLYNLHENNLSQTFEDLTGTPVLQSDGLPQHICSMCGMLLLKSWTFRNKCRQTHVFLQDIQVNRPQITLSYLQSLDKKTFDFSLTKTNVLTLSIAINEDIEREEENMKAKTHEPEQVKQESDLDFGIPDYDFPDMDEPNQEIEDIKNIFELEPQGYSLRETRKRKTEREDKKVKKKKTEKKSKAKTEELDEVKDKPVKRKRLYNRKTEEDFESFAKMYNVEVVFLTKEQQMAEVQARKESDDYISARFQCEECFKSFMKESAFKKHMAWHDPTAGTYVCDICRVRFPQRHKLLKHLRRHRMHFVCKFCNAISKESTIAKMHYKWHEGFKYECQHCGRNFNKPSSYMNHVRENHTTITCDVCQQAVAGTRGLTAHKAMAHSGMFKCATCEAQFISEKALARHTELTAARGCDPCMRPCSHCGEDFLNDRLLSEHLEREHGDKIYRCEECNTTYSSDRQLGIHWSRAHKGQRRRRSDVKSHDGDYMCEVCAKSYPSETTLRYHQRIHTGEKPFQCPMCPKRFRMKTNLQVHINTHTGARPYKCALCPEMFKSYSQKHKHRLLVHTKERRHKCHMCEKTYVVSFDLKMHIKTVHMKIPLPPRNRRRRNNRVLE